MSFTYKQKKQWGNQLLDEQSSGKCSLQEERGGFLLTWEEISGLLCFSPKLWLSNPAGCQQGSTAFQSGASNSEKLILNRDTLHLPAGHFAGKCYLDSTWLPGLPGLGRRWSVAPCPTSQSPRARSGSQLRSLPGSPHKPGLLQLLNSQVRCMRGCRMFAFHLAPS